ncbi:thermonuclease family protein [Chloroflexota bacterium]
MRSRSHEALGSLPADTVTGYFFSACCTLETGKVAHVIDGDTIVLVNGDSVRYIGIDAPELTPQPEPFAREALLANRALVEGKTITMEKDVSERDQCGRLLRYVYIENIFINGELVRRGFARSKAYPPDTSAQKHLNEPEYSAQGTKRGLWAEPTP